MRRFYYSIAAIISDVLPSASAQDAFCLQTLLDVVFDWDGLAKYLFEEMPFHGLYFLFRPSVLNSCVLVFIRFAVSCEHKTDKDDIRQTPDSNNERGMMTGEEEEPL
jgi:hypothetical protein